MSSTTSKNEDNSSPRIGECAATQPLSGITRVDASFAVSGLGHGGFVRNEKFEKLPPHAA